MKAALAALDEAVHRKSLHLARFSPDVGFHRANPVVSEAVPFLRRVFPQPVQSFAERDFSTCAVVERYVANISLVMADLNLTSIVCHTPNPVAADVAGETVLMSLERSRCYGLGGIGSEIWSKLVSPVRVADLVEEFSGRYEAPPGVIERDVLQLLTQLVDEGLIKIC